MCLHKHGFKFADLLLHGGARLTLRGKGTQYRQGLVTGRPGGTGPAAGLEHVGLADQPPCIPG